MKWEKPARGTPSADWYITGESGYVICKALVHGQPIYTLSHRGRLVCTGTREECEERADEDCNAD